MGKNKNHSLNIEPIVQIRAGIIYKFPIKFIFKRTEIRH